MKNKFFSKEFWSKKRITAVSAAGGIAVVAVAVAVPVAITAQSTNTGASDVNTEEQVQVITRDETKNEDYTQDVPYGTPLSELNEFAPVLDGYEAGTLDEQETSYAPTKDAGSKDISASYFYKPLLGAIFDKSTLKVKVKIDIQKAYLKDLENFEGSVPEIQSITGPMSDWTLYDVSKEQVPAGSTIDLSSVEYYINDVWYKVTLSQLKSFFIEPTSLTAIYLVRPDKNHYGASGTYVINYLYTPRFYEPPEEKVLALIGVKGDGSPSSFQPLQQKPGYSYSPFREQSGIVGDVKFYLAKYLKNEDSYTRFFVIYQIFQPYINFSNSLFEKNEIKFEVKKSFGTKMTFEPPPKVEDYEDWAGPEYKLTKVVPSTANNYNPDYGDASKPINGSDIHKIPANSEFSVTFQAASRTNAPDLKYVITVKVEPILFDYAFFPDGKLKHSDFGEPISLTVDRKTSEILGSNASWDISNPQWKVVKEGKGEIGKFKSGFVLSNQNQIQMLPSSTIISAQLSSSNQSINILSKEADRVIIAYEIKAPQSSQILAAKYGDELDAIKTLAKSKFVPTDRKEPEFVSDFSTYKVGLIPGQISYVVYKYDSTVTGKAPLYKTYQVQVQKTAIEDYSQTSTPSEITESGKLPVAPTAVEAGLPNGWMFSGGNTEYYLGTSITPANKRTVDQIKSLTNLAEFTAVYKIDADKTRYEDKSSTYKVTYSVRPPSPFQINYLPQKPAFADSTNKSWVQRSAPAAPSGWAYVSAHYTSFKGISGFKALGNGTDQPALKTAIEQDASESLEIIWIFVNAEGKYLWIVEPFTLSGDNASYYKETNTRKAVPASGTKVKSFSNVQVWQQTGTSPVAFAIDPNDQTYLIDKSAGTVFSITYTDSDGKATTREMEVQASVLSVSSTRGRFKLIKADTTATVAPTRSVPTNFGQKATNKAEYAFESLAITEQTNARPGIYMPGFKVTTFTGLSDAIKLFPAGTTFTITWFAEPINNNYTSPGAQHLVDTYVVVDQI